MDAPLLVSVIVPVWNREGEIRDCVAAIANQTLSRQSYEIIVVDNGSTDGTAQVARDAGATVLTEPRPGSYSARNLGLSVAQGEFVAFTDSDCIADPRWLEAALEAARANPTAGLIAGRVEFETPGQGPISACEAYERAFSFDQGKNVNEGVAATANWFARRSLLQALGGFRDDLKSGGDFELARRIRAAGHTIEYAPQAAVYHPVRATFLELASKARRVTGGVLTMRGTSRSPARWAWISAVKCARRIGAIWRRPKQSPALKLKMSLICLGLLAATVLETGKIALGGEARRS